MSILSMPLSILSMPLTIVPLDRREGVLLLEKMNKEEATIYDLQKWRGSQAG